MPITIVNHPLVQHKLGLLREADISTINSAPSPTSWRVCWRMKPPATSSWSRSPSTAGAVTSMQRIKGKVTVVPSCAGLGMLDGVLDLVPSAKISVVGLYRNEETPEPVPYFDKFVDSLDERIALIIDPMLATGGSMIATIDLLKRKGLPEHQGHRHGGGARRVKAVSDAHPDVEIVTALDSHLNEHGYIIRAWAMPRQDFGRKG